MLIYSLELLHWPWMGDWLCVLIQCLPEVSHSSEFYIDSAITFKVENLPHSQENNSENCRRHVFHLWNLSPQKHRPHTGMCVLKRTHKQRQPHTYSYNKHKHSHSLSSGSHFFQLDREGVWLCTQVAVAPDLWEIQLPWRKNTPYAKCFITIILPGHPRLLTYCKHSSSSVC